MGWIKEGISSLTCMFRMDVNTGLSSTEMSVFRSWLTCALAFRSGADSTCSFTALSMSRAALVSEVSGILMLEEVYRRGMGGLLGSHEDPSKKRRF